MVEEENKRNLLVDKLVVLEKFPGKGGWTFARIPEIPQEKRNPFGWKKVNGFIDSYEIKEYHLMPMGNGQLFMPVKAEIRKKINKQEGDWVNLVLYAEYPGVSAESDLLVCLEDEPEALRNFKQFSETEQERYIDWIAAARTDDVKIDRLAAAIDMIASGKLLKNH